MPILLFLFLMNDREVFRPVDSENANWAESATWVRTDNVPDQSDRVRVPGRSGNVRSVVIEEATQAQATSLFVGTSPNGSGTLTINGRLLIGGVPSAQDRQPGRLYVGRDLGEGFVNQEPGSQTAVRSLRIGYESQGRGYYFVNDATLTATQSIYLATEKTTVGMLELSGAASARTKHLLIGRGDASLQFLATTHDLPFMTVTRNSQLAGSLEVNLDTLVERPDEIVFVQNKGTVAGGFRRVLISSGSSDHYELTYFGGDGNDLALRKASPVNRFEDWVATKFSENAGLVGPLNDPDGDFVSNVGEYKLGCCPNTNEGPAFRKGVNSEGFPFIRFTHRTDRDDVVVVPQVSTNGRVWSSHGVSTRAVSNFGNSQTLVATANAPDVTFRLAFEMLPDNNVKPNVLFITIDDLNDWTEGLGGHPQAITPNLNRIAARGMRFNQAFCAATLCNPSRVAILTGRRPAETGIYDNGSDLRNSPVLANALTLPENFQTSGYRITGGGKLFHSSPFLESWDDYFPSLTKSIPGSPSPPNAPLNGIITSHGRFDWGPIDVEDERMGDARVASWIREQLADPASEEPFFMACGFFRPHLPFYVPPRDFELWDESEIQLPAVFQNDLDDLPEPAISRLTRFTDHQSVLDNNQWQKAVHSYLACIHFADRQLGRVLDALDSSPRFRNTIVVVMSDHGWQLGEKTAWRKNTFWDESTRVPLIIVAPGVTTPGTSSDECVSLVDVYPTLNEICELNAVTPLDGESLAPLLRDSAATREAPAITTQFFNNHAIRTERWRYIRYSTGHEELYDHSIDPNEWHNLASDPAHEPVLEELRPWVPTFNHEYVGGFDGDK